MDTNEIYASKDEYMQRKYSDSSDDENKGKKRFYLKDLKLLKENKRIKSPVKGNLKQSKNVTKPNLDIKPRSPKQEFLHDGEILIPGNVNQYLYPYQRDGIVFLWKHFKENRGCVLADDMGLGKTIQVIGLFVAVLQNSKQKKGPVLVVAPTSVLYNWADELEVWGDFRVGMFHRKSKQDIMELVKASFVDIVLTTHETMRIYLDTLSEVTWSVVVFDEVHKIKEPKAQLTIAAKQLPSYCRVGLTGTPLQNNLKELWCLLDWANPMCLGSSKDFEERFAKPISLGQRFDANKRELATARKKQKELVLLHSEWMLRRTKDMIQNELPNKEEKIVFCPVSALQASLYGEILKLPKCQMLIGLDINCKCGSERIGRRCCLKKYNWRRYLFPFIQLFLKLSNHAALILPKSKDHSKESSSLAKEVCEEMFTKLPQFEHWCRNRNFSNLSNVTLCGKMHVLQKLLHVLLERRDKILIFSNSTQLLSIIEAYVMSRGLIYRRIDGETPANKRHQIVKEFNADQSISICLLSTLVGSLGMNFTGANIVIIFDPLWNPTYEQQAQDRAYRIGQRRDVSVYRFISVGTIEENIYMRQIYKQQLSNIAVEMSNERRYFSGVAGNTDYRGELFGITNMFKFSKDHNSSFMNAVFGKTRHRENDVETAKYEPVVPVKSEGTQNEAAQRTTQNPDESDEEYSQVASQHEDLISWSEEEDKEKHDGKTNDSKQRRKNEKIVERTLAGCAVSFAPSSKSLIGSSKREELLSKHAINDVFWNGLNSQDAANDDGIISESEESQDVGTARIKNVRNNQEATEDAIPVTAKTPTKSMFERIGSVMFMIGGTPPGILAQQFQVISEREGFKTVEEFAEHILNSSSPEGHSRSVLRSYYLDVDPAVRNVSSFETIYGETKHTAHYTSTMCSHHKQQQQQQQQQPFKRKNTASYLPVVSTSRQESLKRRKRKKSTAFVFNYSNDSSSSDDNFDFHVTDNNGASKLKHQPSSPAESLNGRKCKNVKKSTAFVVDESTDSLSSGDNFDVRDDNNTAKKKKISSLHSSRTTPLLALTVKTKSTKIIKTASSNCYSPAITASSNNGVQRHQGVSSDNNSRSRSFQYVSRNQEDDADSTIETQIGESQIKNMDKDGISVVSRTSKKKTSSNETLAIETASSPGAMKDGDSCKETTKSLRIVIPETQSLKASFSKMLANQTAISSHSTQDASWKENTKFPHSIVIPETWSILDELMSTGVPTKRAQRNKGVENNEFSNSGPNDHQSNVEDAIDSSTNDENPGPRKSTIDYNSSKFDPSKSILDDLLDFTPARCNNKKKIRNVDENLTPRTITTTTATKTKVKLQNSYTSILDELLG